MVVIAVIAFVVAFAVVAFVSRLCVHFVTQALGAGTVTLIKGVWQGSRWRVEVGWALGSYAAPSRRG